VAGIAAAALYTQLTRAQIDLVMDDDDVVGQDLEKPGGSDPPLRHADLVGSDFARTSASL